MKKLIPLVAHVGCPSVLYSGCYPTPVLLCLEGYYSLAHQAIPVSAVTLTPASRLARCYFLVISLRCNNDILCDWEARFRTTYVCRGLFGGSQLLNTSRPTLLRQSLIYWGSLKFTTNPIFVRDNLVTSMGAGKLGVLTVEGDTHRRQVRLVRHALFNQPLTGLRLHQRIPVSHHLIRYVRVERNVVCTQELLLPFQISI